MLVVDDDASIRRLVSLILTDEGHEVVVAENGLEAFRQLGTVLPHVIVLDLEMPVMDGRDFFNALRGGGNSQPVILLTALDAQANGRKLGADAALDKPFDVEDLIRLVSELCCRTSSGDVPLEG